MNISKWSCVTVTALAVGFSASAQAQSRITIGTNPAGTVYHVIGGGLAKVLSEKLGRAATVQPFAGSSVYLPLISDGEVTAGLSSSLDSGRAYNGVMNGEPMTGLRTLARLWPLSYGYMVRADSGIKTIADLRGKRVVVEIKANDSLSAANRAILTSAGLSEADVNAMAIGDLPQGVQGVQQGSIDATAVAVGIPLTREAHASVPGGIFYPSLSGANANSEFLSQQYPGLYLVPLQPSPNLPGVVEGTQVTGFDIMLLVSAKMPDAVATEILKTLYENWDGLQTDYPPLKAGKKDLLAAASNTVPYHPAAKAYFKSVGLWGEANDAHDAAIARK